jgi:signal transduction histidine kinase
LSKHATKRRDKNVVTIASEQTASLSAVVSIVHDLRNPLATIHGSAEMLVRSRLSQPQVHRIARDMYCASVRMRELLEEFLERSRVAEKEREPCDLRELVTSAVEKIAISAEFQSVHIVQVVIDHGGKICAESIHPRACFAVRLPRTIRQTSTVSR